MKIQSPGGGAVLNLEKWSSAWNPRQVESTVQDLNFIPFYFRANRGGTGQMRVGLKVLH